MATVTNMSVTVMWEEPTDANGVVSRYRVAISLDSELSARNVTGTPLETVFRDLKPFTNYSISVRAFTDSGRIPGEVAMENVTTEIGGM